jgi:hypothetical protein
MITVGTTPGTLKVWINLNPTSVSDATFRAHSVDIQLVAP